MKISTINNINVNKKYTDKNISMKAYLPNFIKADMRDYGLGNESEFKKYNRQKVLSALKNEFLPLILSKFLQNSEGRYIPQNSVDFFTEFDKCLGIVRDKKIADYINTKLKEISEKSAEYIKSKETYVMQNLCDLSNAVDAYNSLKGNYSALYTPDPWGFNEIRLLKSLHKGYIDLYRTNSPRAFLKFNKELSKHAENSRKWAFSYPVIDFANMQKYSPLSNFYEVKDNELENYIYEKYYLNSNSIPKAHLKLLNDIYKNTGVKVVLSKFDKSTLEIIKLIKQELNYWQTYSQGKAKFPPTLIVTRIHEYFINRSASAYVSEYGNIYLSHGNGIYGLNSTLRHELIHINEQKRSFFGDNTADKNLAKLVNSIIKTKKIQENGYTKNVLDFEMCKYREELLKAGIEPSLIKYGYNNKSELLAVAGEGDLSQCCEEFKNKLVKMGLPEYVLKMPCSVDIIIRDNVEKVKKIMMSNPKIKTYNSIMKYYNNPQI